MVLLVALLVGTVSSSVCGPVCSSMTDPIYGYMSDVVGALCGGTVPLSVRYLMNFTPSGPFAT